MITINGNDLTTTDVFNIAIKKEKIQISGEAIKRIISSYLRVKDLAQQDTPFYGINTGYGIFSDKKISIRESKILNKNLIYSHAVATGDPLQNEIVRAAMAIRVNTLAKGYSGINIKIIHALVSMLNQDVIPIVPSKGSLGSSGDLCLLAHIALVILDGEDNKREEFSGKAKYKGKTYSGKEAMQLAKIKQVSFSHKDGLAIINGATFCAAITALITYRAMRTIKLADMAVALSLEALFGKLDAFDDRIQQARGMDGQIVSARNIRSLLKNSNFHQQDHNVQDAYSLRCVPQVHGAIRDTLNYAERIIVKEINAATDNPLIFEDNSVLSGGNFHGAPIGMIADFLGIAICELSAISERRIARIIDKSLNCGLPSMLVESEKNAGLNSGIMLLQYTAAALVLKNQTIATPDSIKSLPTSANQEDHNANAYNASIHLFEIFENASKVLGIELFASLRAIEIRKEKDKSLKLGTGTQQVYTYLRDQIPYRRSDYQWQFDMELIYTLIQTENEDFYCVFADLID